MVTKSSFRKHARQKSAKSSEISTGSNGGTLSERVNQVYQSHVCPIEAKVGYLEGHLKENQFGDKPIIMLIGNYSSGKTSFIQHLLNQTLKTMNIGPQPTTDVFNVYSYGETETVLSGRLALSNPRYPFEALEKHGDEFISRFNIHETNNPMLKGVILVDTPGVLSGDSSGCRGFKFSEVIFEMAKIAYRIIVMIDPSKVDVSEPLKEIIHPLSKRNHDKMMVVVNKCHTLTLTHAIDIFTGIAWHLSKAIDAPEMMKFYICSFINPLPQNCELFFRIEKDMKDFVSKFTGIAKSKSIAIINTAVERIRNIRCFLYLCREISSKLPVMFKENQKKNVLAELTATMQKVSAEHAVPISDFPKEHLIRSYLETNQLGNLPPCKPKYLESLQIAETEMMKFLDQAIASNETNGSKGALDYKSQVENNPFTNHEEGFEELITRDLATSLCELYNCLEDKSVTGFVKYYAKKSAISQNLMSKIWDICAVLRDENSPEVGLKTFCCMFFFAKLVENKIDLPSTVPNYWINLINELF